MMNLDELRALYDRDQRINAVHPDVRSEVTPEIVRQISLTGDGIWVVYSSLNETNADTVIKAEIRNFEKLDYDWEWKLYSHDQPSDLKSRLAEHGFEIGDEEAILVLDLQDAPAALFQPLSHDVQRVTSPEMASEVISVQNSVEKSDFGWLGLWMAEQLALHPQYLSVYLAYADGMPVSSVWCRYPENSVFASLWGGSTLEAYRGRGYYTALLAARAQEARERGRRFLTVDASPMSRPILEKLGFQLVAYSYPCLWRAAKI